MGVIIIDEDGEEEVNTCRKERRKDTPDLREKFDPRRIPMVDVQIVPVMPDIDKAKISPPPPPAGIHPDSPRAPGKPVLH